MTVNISFETKLAYFLSTNQKTQYVICIHFTNYLSKLLFYYCGMVLSPRQLRKCLIWLYSFRGLQSVVLSKDIVIETAERSHLGPPGINRE